MGWRFDGVTLQDDVFVARGRFYNDRNPRSHRAGCLGLGEDFSPKRGKTDRGHATVMCGVTIGTYAVTVRFVWLSKNFLPIPLSSAIPAAGRYACCCGRTIK